MYLSSKVAYLKPAPSVIWMSDSRIKLYPAPSLILAASSCSLDILIEGIVGNSIAILFFILTARISNNVDTAIVGGFALCFLVVDRLTIQLRNTIFSFSFATSRPQNFHNV
jgi:hypothetical protein